MAEVNETSSLDLAEEETDDDISVRTYLWSIIRMPRYMWMLCLTHLLCFMALETCALFYTDYVGQAVYGGSPDATASLDEQTYYTSGVTMGSLVLAMESVAMALYSPFIHALSTKFGIKSVYIFGLLCNCLGTAVTAITSNLVVTFISGVTIGILYATLSTVPFILLTTYHKADNHVKGQSRNNTDEAGSHSQQHRGIGTDIAIVSSMIFVAQFLLSAILGSIVHSTGTTAVVPASSSVLSLLAAVTVAFGVRYT